MSGNTNPLGDLLSDVALESGEVASTPSLAAWLAYSTAGLFIFYQLVLQSLPSVIRDGLVVDFSLTDAGFGGMAASFYYPYMLLQIPSGLLILRYGSRRVLIAGLILCILASFITAYSLTVAHVTTARILMGIGAAPAFVATMALATRWFPARLFPILVAVTEMIAMLGAALGQEILGLVVQSAGWRAAMSLCAWSGIAVLVMTLAFVWDSPPKDAQNAVAARRLRAGPLLRMLLAPSLILAGLIGGMIYSAALSFAMLWGVPFFKMHLGIDLAAASLCASFFSWGIIVGMLAFGWACGRLADPVTLLGLGILLTAASVALILYGPPDFMLASLGMLLCGIGSGSYPLAFVIVKSEAPQEATGAALALANMLIIAVGGLVLQPLIGILADTYGRPVTDPESLGVLLWAQGLGLLLLVPLIFCLRDKTLMPRWARSHLAKAS